MSAPTPGFFPSTFSELLLEFSAAFNAQESHPSSSKKIARTYIDDCKQALKSLISTGTDPSETDLLGCVPLTYLIPLNSPEIFEEFVDLLHPVEPCGGRFLDHYNPTIYSASPVLFTLLKQQQFCKAKILFDRGARLNFYHPIFKTHSLQFLCYPFSQKPKLSEERNAKEKEAQIAIIQEALKNPALPWRHRGQITIPETTSLSALELLVQLTSPAASPEARYPIDRSLLDQFKGSLSGDLTISSIRMNSTLLRTLRDEYLAFIPFQKTSPWIAVGLAIDPANMLISLMLNNTISRNECLDEQGNTLSHLAAIHGDLETIKELLRCGLFSTRENVRGQDPLTFSVMQKHLSTHDFMRFLFSIESEFPAGVHSCTVHSKLTQLLMLYLIRTQLGKAVNVESVIEWANYFLDHDLRSHARLALNVSRYCDIIKDPLGRFPLEIATQIPHLDSEFYQRLAIHEAQYLYSLERRFEAKAIEIIGLALFKEDYEKISILMCIEFPGLLQPLPIQGGTFYLKAVKECLDLMTETKPLIDKGQANLILSCIVYTHKVLKSLNFQISYLVLEEGKLAVHSTFSIVRNFHQAAQKVLRIMIDSPESRDNPEKHALHQDRMRKITETLAYLSTLGSDPLMEFYELDEALDFLHGPSLFFSLVLNSSHDSELVERLSQLKKVFREKERFTSIEAQAHAEPAIAMLISDIEKKIDLAEQTKEANRIAEDLLAEEEAEKTSKEASKKNKKKPKKTEKKAPPAKPIPATPIKTSVSTKKPVGGAGRSPSPEPEPEFETPSPESSVSVAPLEMVSSPPKRKRSKRGIMPDYFLPYEKHYQLVESLFSRYLSFDALDDRLWIYGSLLDSEIKSVSGDIDFVLYLETAFEEKRIEESNVYFRKALEKANPGVSPSAISVLFHAKHQCWTLTSPHLLIDIRLSVSPDPVEVQIQSELAHELIIHKARRFNPHSGREIRKSEKQNFELLKNPYKESLPEPNLIAYLIKNFAVSTRKLEERTRKMLEFMMLCLSFDPAKPKAYTVHFIALNLAFHKYTQHRQALLDFCDEHQCFPRLLGISSPSTVHVSRLPSTEALPFYAACVLHKEETTLETLRTLNQILLLSAQRFKLDTCHVRSIIENLCWMKIDEKKRKDAGVVVDVPHKEMSK